MTISFLISEYLFFVLFDIKINRAGSQGCTYSVEIKIKDRVLNTNFGKSSKYAAVNDGQNLFLHFPTNNPDSRKYLQLVVPNKNERK